MQLATIHFPDKFSLRSIQRVRIVTGIIHLSDLYSADGRALDTQYLNTNLPPTSNNSYEWPVKYHINRHDMAKWRKFVRKLFAIDEKYLATPSGPWIPMDNTQ